MPIRTRSETITSTSDVGYITSTYQNRPDVRGYDRTYSTNSETRTLTDESHPGYFQRIKRGELIIGYLYKISDKMSSGGGSYGGTWTGAVSDGTQLSFTYTAQSMTAYFLALYLDSPSLSLPSTPDVVDDSKSQALAGITASTGNLMEDVLTIRQTLASITGILRSIHELADDFSRSPLRFTSGGWLKYRMEILPLYGALQDLFKVLHGVLKVYRKNIRQRSTGTAQAYSRNTGNSVISGRHYALSHTIEKSTKAIVYYHVRTDVGDVLQNLGLDASSLPKGLWATVKLSFMVDRFLNVSSMLDGLTRVFDPNIVIEGGCYTVVTKTISTTQLISVDPVQNWSIHCAGDPIIRERTEILRSAWYPSAVDTLPPLNFGGLVSSANRAADLAALISQRLMKCLH